MGGWKRRKKHRRATRRIIPKPVGTDRHHRRCRSNGGSWDDSNISRVKITHHRAWHLLTGNMLPEEIAKIFNEIWLDPEWEFVAVRRSKPNSERWKGDGLA